MTSKGSARAWLGDCAGTLTLERDLDPHKQAVKMVLFQLYS